MVFSKRLLILWSLDFQGYWTLVDHYMVHLYHFLFGTAHLIVSIASVVSPEATFSCFFSDTQMTLFAIIIGQFKFKLNSRIDPG